MLSNQQFLSLFQSQIPFELTASQKRALPMLTDFVCETNDNHVFILKGYAGTGKTTVVSALVKTLKLLQQKSVLLAPTGRSAKVFSLYSSQKAYTIHKCLYRMKLQDGISAFARRENKSVNTLFIVDEASMIADSESETSLFGNRSLLDDLFSFVFEGDHCQLLLVGDDAQLPPVNYEDSPALSIEYIQRNFALHATSCALTDVTRQSHDSGILLNASLLRQKIQNEIYEFPLFSHTKFDDCIRVNGEDLEDLLYSLHGKYSSDEVVIITYSNKRAFIYNQEIRHRILYREEQIATGDYVIAVKNNYFWIKDDAEVGFIANGDNMEVLAINKIQELYGFHFADVTVRLCDYPHHDHIDIKIILESLDSEGAALSAQQNNLLYSEISKDYEDISSKRLRYLKMKENPFLNAVQVKFSYSLTCHKTQGGQWAVVLLDQGLIKDGILTKSYFRWLYTALTRATEKVYLINFNDAFFGNP
jgi:ATP-dependent exoDNAse (exonuclease V) alpha subunit